MKVQFIITTEKTDKFKKRSRIITEKEINTKDDIEAFIFSVQRGIPSIKSFINQNLK